MERLTEYLSFNFALVIYVIAVPRQFYKDFNSEETGNSIIGSQY